MYLEQGIFILARLSGHCTRSGLRMRLDQWKQKINIELCHLNCTVRSCVGDAVVPLSRTRL